MYVYAVLKSTIESITRSSINQSALIEIIYKRFLSYFTVSRSLIFIQNDIHTLYISTPVDLHSQYFGKRFRKLKNSDTLLDNPI